MNKIIILCFILNSTSFAIDNVHVEINNRSERVVSVSTQLSIDRTNNWTLPITVLSVGVMTKLFSRKFSQMTTDMWVASAAGSVFVLSELYGRYKTQEDLSKRLAAISINSRTGVNQEQVSYLRELREGYNGIHDSIQRKKSFQRLAQASFLAAAGIAGYQAFQQGVLAAKASSSVSIQIASLTSASSTNPLAAECATEIEGKAPQLEANMSKDLTVNPKNSKLSANEIITRATQNTSYGVCTAAADPSVAAILAPVQTSIAEYNTFTNSVTTAAPVPTPSEIKTQVIPALSVQNEKSKFNLDWMFPSAYALDPVVPSAFNAFTSMDPLMVGFFAATLYGVWTFADQIISSPMGRIVLWSGFAALIQQQLDVLETTGQQTENNIAQIDQMIGAMDANTKGMQLANNLNGYQPGQTYTMNGGAIQALNLPQPAPCMISSGSTNCGSLAQVIKDMPANLQIPPNFQGILTGLGTTMDQISGKKTISGSTIGSINSIGNQVGAIKKQNAATMTKLASTSKGPVPDVAALSSKAASDIVAVTNKAFSAEKPSVISGLAQALGLSSAPVTTANIASDNSPAKKVEKKLETTASAAATAPAPAADSTALNLNVKDDNADRSLSSAAPSNPRMEMGKRLEELGYVIQEINKDEKKSLFEIISARYIKSGYRRLLQDDQ